MTIWVHLLLVLIAPAFNLCSEDGLEAYCKYSKDNTPCKTKCVRSKDCGNTFDRFRVLNDDVRHHIEMLHNGFRENISEKSFRPFPMAYNLGVISYDLEAEFLAGCHIKSCQTGHDSTRLSLTGKKMGQIFYDKHYPRMHLIDPKIFNDAFEAWKNDLIDYAWYHGNSTYGDLIQLVSNITKYVGCAIIHVNHIDHSISDHIYKVVCNYLEYEAQTSEVPYLYREISGVCVVHNADFPHLCGKTRPYEDDKFIAPVDLNSSNKYYNNVFAFIIYILIFVLFNVQFN